jgi:hypothetical protein
VRARSWEVSKRSGGVDIIATCSKVVAEHPFPGDGKKQRASVDVSLIRRTVAYFMTMSWEFPTHLIRIIYFLAYFFGGRMNSFQRSLVTRCVVAQPHCHHLQSIVSVATTETELKRTGDVFVIVRIIMLEYTTSS